MIALTLSAHWHNLLLSNLPRSRILDTFAMVLSLCTYQKQNIACKQLGQQTCSYSILLKQKVFFNVDISLFGNTTPTYIPTHQLRVSSRTQTANYL